MTDAVGLGSASRETAESRHPGRIGRLNPSLFVFKLSAERVGDELPQTDSAQQHPGFGQPEQFIRMSIVVFTTRA